MTDWDLEQKRSHAARAEAAISSRRPRLAAFHLAYAARHALELAGRTDGMIRATYNREAGELLDLASQFSVRAADDAPANKLEHAGKPDNSVRQNDDDAPRADFILRERPSQKLADIAGLHEAKQAIQQRVLMYIRNPEAFEQFKLKPGGGMLLYGPPGTGKTMLARGVAGEIDAAFYVVDAAQMKSKWHGESEKLMKQLFDEARQNERAIVFIDEAESLLAQRGGQRVNLVAQFLREMDGFKPNGNCLLVMAATNKPWLLSSAVLREGRLGTHIYVGLPDAATRKAILSYHCAGVPRDADVDFGKLAESMNQYSGADVAAVCDHAKRCAVQRLIDTRTPQQLGAADFADAVSQIRPKTDPQEMRRLLEWRCSSADSHDSNDAHGDDQE